MKVFLSWSGERSKQLALCLKNWLPKVIQSLEPWMSAEDIRAGGRWLLEIGTQLEETSFGVVCLTPENLKEPWILFEAGALGKMLRTASVCPYLLGVEPSTITGPLAQFQAKRTSKDETLSLLESMNTNSSSGEPQRQLSDTVLREAFEKWWPDLEASIKAIPNRADVPAPRSDHDMIEEILNITRQVVRQTPHPADPRGNRLLGFRDFVRSRRAALAGFMNQGAQLIFTGNHLIVMSKNSIYNRYLTDNESVLTELACEFFQRPITVRIASKSEEPDEPSEPEE